MCTYWLLNSSTFMYGPVRWYYYLRFLSRIPLKTPLSQKLPKLNPLVTFREAENPAQKMIGFPSGKPRVFNKGQLYPLFVINFSFANVSHSTFRPWFYLTTRSSWVSLSIPAFLNRLTTALELIMGCYYFDQFCAVLGNKRLWHETMLLNWVLFQRSSLSFELWRHHFFFYDQKWTTSTELLVSKFRSSKVDTFFLIDILAHQVNLRFLKKARYYLMGLVPVNVNPWVVHFAVPIFTHNLLILYYTLRLLYFAFIQAETLKFRRFKKLW